MQRETRHWQRTVPPIPVWNTILDILGYRTVKFETVSWLWKSSHLINYSEANFKVRSCCSRYSETTLWVWSLCPETMRNHCTSGIKVEASKMVQTSVFRHLNPLPHFSLKHGKAKSHPYVFTSWSTRFRVSDLWTSQFQSIITQMEFPSSKTGFQQGWEHTPHYDEIWRMAHDDLEKQGLGLDVKLHAIALNWEE